MKNIHACLLQQKLDGIRGVASLRLLRLARCQVGTWKLRDAKSKKSKKNKKYSPDSEEEALGSKCENRLHVSACRVVHEKRHCNRPVSGFIQGFSKRARVRNEDAELFHQPGGQEIEPYTTGRIGTCGSAAFKTH
jgi:hypothetical protein